MGRQANILIVEDEALVAMDIESQVTHLGHHVVGTADTGPDAIKLAEAHQPDVVLMDIKLKGSMDGIEAAKEIRRQWGCGVVFVTAHGDAMTAWKAAATYPSSYVLKPFDERSLSTAIILAFVQKTISGPIDKITGEPGEPARRLTALAEIMKDHIAEDFMLLDDFERLRDLLAQLQSQTGAIANQINSLLDGISSRTMQFNGP
ncbi:MAG: response regulator [Chloroflexi bacterium]|nr:response regulator [Chloroflexota bacterium]